MPKDSPAVPAMPPALSLALDRARAEWLAGDPAAWHRYRACLAQATALPKARPDRPRAERRPRRARVRARA